MRLPLFVYLSRQFLQPQRNTKRGFLYPRSVFDRRAATRSVSKSAFCFVPHHKRTETRGNVTMFKRQVKRCRELIVYCMIGCTGAGLDFAIYAALAYWSGMHYQIANFISVSFGILNNFFLNYFFNFKAKGRMLVRLVCFYSIGMFGWVLSVFGLWMFIERIGMNAIAAKLGTIVFVTIVQFCLNKFITFRKNNSNKEVSNVR